MGTVGAALILLHGAGLEIVSLYDRPEGSRLGRYHYVIEAESEAGITDAQIDAVCAMEGMRFAGRFKVVEKGRGGSTRSLFETD